MRKWCVLIMVVFLLTGCGEAELEDKEFPMTLGLDIIDKEFKIIYDLPDLSEATDQEKEQEQDGLLEVQGENLTLAQEEYQRSTDKQLDYSHLKAIVISQKLLEEKKLLESLLEYFEGHNEISQNVLVFVSKTPKEVIDIGSKKAGALGLYLEKLMSNQVQEEQKVTIGNLITHWRSQNEVLVIPFLKGIEESNVRLEKGAILQRLIFYGELQEEEKEILRLSKGKLVEKTFNLKGKPEICVKKAIVSYKIVKVSSVPVVTLKIVLKGETKENIIKNKEDLEEAKQIIANQIQVELETLEKKWGQKESIDFWNTFTMIGSRNRDLWKEYHKDQVKYEKERKINFIIEWSGI